MAELATQYARQARWRRWDTVLDALPLRSGQRVLDLGCAVGAQSALLTDRGATVTGVDGDPTLLAAARQRGLRGARFLEGDLRHPERLPPPAAPFDGLWCSFVPAYFPDLSAFLAGWLPWLGPGAWVALLEIDDMLNHAPLAPEYRAILDGFGQAARDAGHYDFWSGRRLAPTLRALGLTDVAEYALPDDELSFQGPAEDAVWTSWAQRLDRMRGLQTHAGAAFPALRAALLDCLRHPAHTTRCRVVGVTARVP